MLDDAGCATTTFDRFVDDVPAARAGLSFVTTARDLARLMGALAGGTSLEDAPTADALRLLRGSDRTEDVVSGLPLGADVEHKNGWDVVDGRTVRHSVALVPPDARPCVQAVCTTTTLPDAGACALVADLTREAWLLRHG